MEQYSCNEEDCKLLKVQPLRVCFKFRMNISQEKRNVLTITNVSNSQQNIKINPPMTEYFTIEPPWLGQVQSSILPKETIRMRVVLKRAPLEPRPHYDSMQITNSNDCQIHVTLEALPRFKTLDNLPRSLDFGDVPLGLKKVKKFTLKPLNFDTPYVITFAEPTQHLEVWPTRGILKPGCPPVVVTVTYVPMAPVTLATSIWLRLPTVMYGPVAIRVTGRGCTQGTCRKVKKRQAKAPPKETNPTVVRSFKRWKQPGWASKMSAKRPRTTWSKAACTRKILMKSLKDRQHTEHELDGPLMANSQEAARRKTVFGQKMESWGRSLEDEAVLTEREERRFFEGVEIVHTLNRLAFSHMRDKLRELEEPLLASARLARESEWTEYLKRYLVPTYKPNDHQPLYVRQRIVRRADTVEPMKTFADKLPNEWFPRYVAMAKFIEAGRQIMLKNRLNKVLGKFRTLTPENVVAFEVPPADPF